MDTFFMDLGEEKTHKCDGVINVLSLRKDGMIIRWMVI